MNYIIKWIVYFFYFYVTIFFFFNATLFADRMILDDKKIVEYANYLYKKKEYYRAISEYKRLLYFFPDSSYYEYASLQIGRAYLSGFDFQSALEYWEKYDFEESSRETTFQVQKLHGITWLSYKENDPFPLRLPYIKNAMEVFNQIDSSYPGATQIFDFVETWKNRNVESAKKSPFLAGTLSAIIPGSGSLYVGRNTEALYALFIPALFCFATIDAIRNESNLETYIFGFFTLAFYGGNIYTAINSTYKYNDRIESQYLNQLQLKYNIFF